MDIARQEIQHYLTRFDRIINELATSHRVEKLAAQIHVVHPKVPPGQGISTMSGKDVSLTISALIHGVEIAGLAVVVEFLELVTRGEVQLTSPIGVALGNVPAALQGARFLERDLNRSFGRPDTKLAEEKRADELEALFTRSAHLLDIHQVKLQIDRPFWIFPYTPGGYGFARAVAPDVSLITHWGPGFSKDGQCSDEWVNGRGGFGVTIELGQNGFDREQIAHGVKLCRRALQIANLPAAERATSKPNSGSQAPLYTWGEIIPYPPTGRPVLHPGWHNFKMVRAGETLGSFGGVDIKAKVSGPVLFPKYPDARPDGSYGEDPPAAELIRILQEISEDDLPKKTDSPIR